MFFNSEFSNTLKRLIYSSILSSLLLFFIIACGNKNAQDALIAPEGMSVLDLSKYGKSFALFVPDTLKARLRITELSSGALEIRVGENFGISVNEQAADITLMKNDIKNDEVNKLKSFITDEPSAILWESEIVQPEFHFCVNQKIENAEYSFEDIKATDAKPFSKGDIQKMFDCARNIKVIQVKTNS